MKIKSIAFVLAAFLSVCFGLTLIIPSGSARSTQIERATPIQIGVMTERQKEHSKLYSKYDSTRKIPDLVEKEKNDVEVFRLLPLGADVSGGFTPTTGEILRQAACTSNAIILGVVKDKFSQLTESKSFIFTDYEITVKEVLKNNESAPINSNTEIIVTRPGGTIALNGKKVRAIDESFPPLKMGETYILFLRFLTPTNTYTAIETGESFEVQGNTIKSLRGESLDRFAAEHTAISLANEIRVAAAGPCKGNKGGAE